MPARISPNGSMQRPFPNAVTVGRAASRLHNRVTRKMAVTFEENRKPEPRLMIDTDIDVRVTDVPLNVRQPDVTVSRCIPDDQRLYSTDVVLVVEVVSPAA